MEKIVFNKNLNNVINTITHIPHVTNEESNIIIKKKVDIDVSNENMNRILEFEKNLSFELNDPYYYIKKNVLTNETCEKIINMFEKSEKHKGITSKGLEINIKKTYEVLIEGKEWQEIDKLISNILTKSINEYSQRINLLTNNGYINNKLLNNITDNGYHIQKYIKGDGFYKWHNDFSIGSEKSCRIITFLFYLNDVEEGGETYFYNGKIKPETGKLLLFPATWTYNHKGNMPISNDKYIITGWFYD